MSLYEEEAKEMLDQKEFISLLSGITSKSSDRQIREFWATCSQRKVELIQLGCRGDTEFGLSVQPYVNYTLTADDAKVQHEFQLKPLPESSFTTLSLFCIHDGPSLPGTTKPFQVTKRFFELGALIRRVDKGQ